MMKKYRLAMLALLLTFTLWSGSAAFAATTDLFFSEYIEGSSVNKALEIYNGTGATIDLAADGYSIEMYFNGNTGPGTTIDLTGTVADGDVYVVADDGAVAAILAETDQTSSSSFFNGDDAIVLKKADVIIDAFGQIGTDPGSQWDGGGQNDTLRRSADVCAGDPNASDLFDASVEWATFPQDTFDGLGSHTANCGGGTVDTAPTVASINPANGDTNVALNADVMVTFSEDVNVVGSWAEVSCSVSGVHTTAVTGGPASFTLNPDTDFVNDESCTVAIVAAQVTDADTDDPPDNMDADFVSSFSTETAVIATSDLILSGIVDGPLSGGIPKAIELFVLNNIADLSIYGIGSANNGGGSDGEEFTFPAVSAAAGSYIYVASETDGFTTFFGFAPDYTDSAANVNGDDAIELFKEGSVVDLFGDINVDGNGEPWEYLDGWASRVDGTGPDGDVFNLANWTFSGPNALDGETSNATAANPFPIGVVPGQSLPISEGFDDCTLAGWEIVSVDTDTANTWGCNATYSNIEANGYGDDAPANEWLMTPPLNLNGQENETLTFRNYTNYSDVDYPQLSVLYSTNYNGNGDPTSATWTELTGINFSPEDSGNWVDSGNIDLSGISGINVYIAFNYTSSGTGGGSAATWRLDEINIFAGSSATEYKIHEIQGDAAVSPLDGADVIIEGVVVGDFQNSDQFSGFHVQEEDADVDGDPATSEGIFVYHSSTDVNVGDLVRVTGVVDEYFNLTQVTNVSDVTILSSANSLPTAASVSLPVASTDDFEAYEGMLVTFPQTLFISEFFNFDRFGEIVLSTERQFQPTAVFEPGSPEAAALATDNQLNRITLDDGNSGQNPDPARHPNGATFDLTNTFRGGDTVQDVTGVMDFAFGNYKIQPTVGAIYTSQNPRTSAPDVGGDITVASFNVLNYFTTLDDSGAICGPASNQDCRGADNQEEFDRQRAKIVAALAEINADIFGLIEIENHATDAAVIDLVAGLNDAVGAGTYDYIATGPIGTDAIKVALIYKPATVTPFGSYAILDGSIDARFDNDRNRPMLTQTFFENSDGGTVTVAVNHLKSKGSSCGDGDDDPEQGNCNLTRTLAAQAIVDWLATDPTGSGDADYLIIGDLNAYDKEDPIDALLVGADDTPNTGDDFVDLLQQFGGEFAYSYVFSGQLGYLDYGVANNSLLSQVSGVAAWNINADEPDILDYDTSFKKDAQDALYEPNAYRASDHDPIIIGLELAPALNADGCYILEISGSPYAGPSIPVESYRRVFSGLVWLVHEGLSKDSCLEIHGTNHSDLIMGSRGNDQIFGYGGRDILIGYRGDDQMSGGSGYDRFFGGSGFDTVTDQESYERCYSVEEGCEWSRGWKGWK